MIEIRSTTPFHDLRIEKDYTSIVLISDKTVYPLYGEQLLQQLTSYRVFPILIDAGEEAKTLDTATFCWNEMHRIGVDRHSLVIGLGGGVVTDLAGFVAACYMRGIDVAYIPTTLMGMVDAAVGGKTAVNLSEGKNIVGIFHQPKHVWIYPVCLQSLSQSAYRSGLAEVVKYGIIQSPSLFENMENNHEAILSRDLSWLHTIIRECCAIKTEIVRQDEKDLGIRAHLNLGHTFAHALEALTHYKVYTHGEAVSIGLNCAFHTSKILGFIDDSLIIRLHNLLKRLNLPIALPNEYVSEAIIHLMYGDKKTTSGKLNVILVKEIGKVEQYFNIAPEHIFKALEQARLSIE